MFKKVSISTKITILVVVVVLATVLIVSYLSFNVSRKSIQEGYAENLSLIADSRSEAMHSYFQNILNTMSFAQSAILAPRHTGYFKSDDTTEYQTGVRQMHRIERGVLESFTNIQESNNIKSIHLIDLDGKVMVSTEEIRKFNILDNDFLSKAASTPYFSMIQQETDAIFCGIPSEHVNGETLIFVFEIPASEITRIARDTTGLGYTGENLIARQIDDEIQFLVPYRGDTLLPKPIPFDSSNNARPIKEALLKREGSGISTDYRNASTLAVWRHIPDVDWGLVAKIDMEEINQRSNALVKNYLIAGSIISVFAIIISIMFSRFLLKPVKQIKYILELLGKGILPTEVKRQSNDEIGLMADSLDNVVHTLKDTANFAQKIGEGTFDAEFKPESDDDILGHALVNMRDNLVEAEKNDKERNWIVTGLAELGEILRIHDNISDLGDHVVKYMVERIGAVQGAFYVSIDDEVSEKDVELVSSYAYSRKKHIQKTFRFAEGLVGQAVAEMNRIMRTEIPKDYVTISSGLIGDRKPDCILIVPLINEEQVYGVLEFAGFDQFEKNITDFVDEMSVILARTVFNIKVNERTRRLLEESQKMSAELQEKQEALQQNAEEMQATQEELENSNKMLNEQVEEVNRSQKRMQLLLENASEVITIYEEDMNIRYISPSVLHILGYSQKEMVGKQDLEHIHGDMQTDFEMMFATLAENPSEQITIQYEYKTKSGEYVWLEATGTNFLSNPAIQGIIVNSRDITERRLAEQEQRMRSKMQALSENSPDLITRLEENEISYINPTIEEFTGKKPQDFLNKNVNEVELDSSIINKWLEIVEQVNDTNETVKTEMDFPGKDGDMIVNVNAIPEFDEYDMLESVLVVSHDITKRKVQEIEIQNQNKKIADSINYAKRIQNAILPNNLVINRVLPNSFILYKPKDIVSGDFPWFAHVGKHIYMAAVDCTGHGVPGALLSLIGYFLLNDIVRSRKISDPGIILDQLDEGVTTTLKQDQAENTAKDGMDIALCRIDTELNEVVYAGAHRPLYVMKGGEMVEVKGDKFAIGGGIYKNQTNFKSHTLQLKEGDSFYFCSDGFPDQFGGDGERKKKYGPKRLRSFIEENHSVNMHEAFKLFDKSWTEWQGEEAQIDDVLLIGIKF